MTTITDTELVVVPEVKDALAIYSAKDAKGIEPLLSHVRGKIDAFMKSRPGVETAGGRDEIRSFAFKVAKAKTALEKVGKTLADEQKDIPKRIDATRRRINDTLDQWRDEVRKPLTDWEQAEEDRVNRIKASLAEFQGVIDDQQERSSEAIRDRLDEVKREALTEQFYGDYIGAAVELRDKAVQALEVKLAATEKREAEAAELARLRAEDEARKRREREEQIAREAAERAKREAEIKAEQEKRQAEAAAKAEREAAERKILEARLATEAAEKRAADAEARVRREAEEKAAREKAEAESRERDKKHRAAINNAALQAFVDGGISATAAKKAVELIASRAIPSVSISY